MISTASASGAPLAADAASAHAFSPAAAPAPQRAERRRHRRIPVSLAAKIVVDGEEREGVIQDIGAGGARLKAEAQPASGERIVLYADRLGRLEATVARRTPDGFAVAFSSRSARTKRLADALTWVLNRTPDRDRRLARRYPKNEAAKMTRADGQVQPVRILDISTTGASVGMDEDQRPPLGEEVEIGLMAATVMRHHAGGIGVAFASPTPPEGAAPQDVPN